jgi:hypothetical protein
MADEVCVIKDTEDNPICGEPVSRTLTVSYRWETGEYMEFQMGMCKAHDDAFVERLGAENLSMFRVDKS